MAKRKNYYSDFKNLKIVLEPSILAVDYLQTLLSTFIQCLDAKIIITSFCMSKILHFTHTKSMATQNSLWLLEQMRQNPKAFIVSHTDGICFSTEKSLATVWYCINNNSALLSAEKKIHKLAQQYYVLSFLVDNHKHSGLALVMKHEDGLYIMAEETDLMKVTVVSKKRKTENSYVKLQIGDSVFTSTKKPDGCSYAQYKVNSFDFDFPTELIQNYHFFDKRDLKKVKGEIPREHYSYMLKLLLQPFPDDQ